MALEVFGVVLPTMTASSGGAVPTPPNNTTTFLRGDGVFAVPSGGGGGGGDLLAANNLSDVASASTSRTNLGLGTAATLASSAVAQTANNLSDLASAATARTNLGLGTAATLAATAVAQVANDLSDLASAATARTNLGLATVAASASAADLSTGTLPAARLGGIVLTASTGTFTLANGKTFTVSNTLTLAGTDAAALNIGAGGTLAASAFTDALNASNISSGSLAVARMTTMTASVGGAVPTPPNNTTTFLRGDGTFAAPAGGGGSGDLLSTNNLSDVASVSTSRTNLGLVAVASSGSAADLSTGTLASARISGAYTGITGVGTLAGLTTTAAVASAGMTVGGQTIKYLSGIYMQCLVDGELRFGDNAAGTFTWITVAQSAGRLQLGQKSAAAPVPQFIAAQSVIAGTTNTAGVDWTYEASRSTGTGAGGAHVFKVSPAGGSGTSVNALATALTIDSTKLATFAGAVFATTTRSVVTTVAGLPAAASNAGAVSQVSDASTTLVLGLGGVVAGGGANFAPVWCDGTDWRYG